MVVSFVFYGFRTCVILAKIGLTCRTEHPYRPTHFPIDIHHEESCWFPNLKISDPREAVSDFRYELPFPGVLYT